MSQRNIYERFQSWLIWLQQNIFVLFRRQKVPVLLQMTAVECGAACLAMLLSFHGRKTSVSECRDRFGIGRDGVALQTIVKVARHYGLIPHVYSVDLENFHQMKLPAIIHWKFNHFVVVERWSKKSIGIIDPALGRRSVTPAEFNKSFTGLILTLEAGPQFIMLNTSARAGAAFVQQIMRQAKLLSLLLQVLGASFIIQVLGLTIPLITKFLVDTLIPQQLSDLIPILGCGVLVIVAAQLTSSYLRTLVLLHLQARTDAQLTLSVVDHLLKLPFAFFQHRTSGDLLVRLGSCALIREILTSQTLSIVLDGSFVLVYLVLIFIQMPIFGCIVLLFASLQILLLIGTTRPLHDLAQSNFRAQSQSQGFVVQMLKGITTIKATAAENAILDYWANLFFAELNTSLRLNQASGLFNTVLDTIRIFSALLLLWIGSMFVLQHFMSLGTMLALNALAAAFLLPISSLVNASQQLMRVRVYLERMTDIVEAQPEQDVVSPGKSITFEGQIELKNISFRYDTHSPYVLRNLSLTIQPGQKVAFVGRSGSGKSTLAYLLLGLHKVTEGQILYDGQDISTISITELRNQCGVVLQEPFILSSTILQNITLSDPTLSPEQVVEASGLAGIHDDIMGMSLHYNTLLSENGSNISGGQRQRIALARALVHKPKILILDEATSNLDVANEALVEEHLSGLKCTRIVIAHRLSTVRDADLIVVLDQGQIQEQGTHDELLARNQLYAQLVQLQGDRAIV